MRPAQMARVHGVSAWETATGQSSPLLEGWIAKQQMVLVLLTIQAFGGLGREGEGY